jgi:hypothetical protein
MLAPMSEDVILDKDDRFEKPVSTLAIVPKTGVITRVGRQAYTIMMLLAREQGIEDDNTGLFAAPLNSVIRGFDGSKGTVDELKKHLRSMVTHVIEWQSPSIGETNDWGACTLLSEVRLTKQKGETWLSWAYPPSMRQDLLAPSRYAQIKRSTIAQFRSHAGLALYEICARYKDNPSHLTSKHHWHWWLPVLTGKPSPKEIKTEFRFFNRDTIKPAIEEVNEVSELIVSVHEFKLGRTVQFLQFEVHEKPELSKKEIAKAVGAIDLSKLARAMQLGIDPEFAEDMFIRYGELDFAKAVDRLEARLNMPGKPILSRHAYLKSLLVGKVIDHAPDVAKVEVGQGGGTNSVPVVNPNALKQQKLQESESARVQVIRSEIQALDEDHIAELLAGLKKQFVVRRMSPSVMKRLDEGNWQSALIMSELIRYYWKLTRGLEWSDQSEQFKEAPLSLMVERVEQAKLF